MRKTATRKMKEAIPLIKEFMKSPALAKDIEPKVEIAESISTGAVCADPQFYRRQFVVNDGANRAGAVYGTGMFLEPDRIEIMNCGRRVGIVYAKPGISVLEQ